MLVAIDFGHEINIFIPKRAYGGGGGGSTCLGNIPKKKHIFSASLNQALKKTRVHTLK